MLAAVTRVHSPNSFTDDTSRDYHDPYGSDDDDKNKKKGGSDSDNSFIVSEPSSSATAESKPGSTQGNILAMVPNEDDKDGSYTLEKPATSATSQKGPSSTTAPADTKKDDKKKKDKDKNKSIVVNLNQYDRRIFRFEFDPSSTAEQMDQVIRAAVLLSSDTPYELNKPDGTYIGINDLRASKNDTYNITYDRTTLRLVNNLPHKVFLLEPPKRFSKFMNAFGKQKVNPAIFSPLSCKEVAEGRFPAAMLDVQTPIAIQLKQIDNYGHIYYIIEITAIPMFGLVSSKGPSMDSDMCGWYMGKFSLQIKDIRIAEENHLPKLFIYEYAPTNEIGEVSVTTSTGWNASAGPTLTPAPPFASLSATVGYHDDRTSTSQLKNLNCTYEHQASPDGVPITSWQIELSFFLRHVRKMDKFHTPKMENFHWSNSTSRSIGHIPQEARRLLKKKFMQSYIFEEDPDKIGSSYTFEFEITAAVFAFYSACPGYGRNVLYMYEDGTHRLDHPDKPADRIAAVQRTRVRVDLVPSKMNITVSKVPIHSPREMWKHLANVTRASLAAESLARPGSHNGNPNVQNAGAQGIGAQQNVGARGIDAQQNVGYAQQNTGYAQQNAGYAQQNAGYAQQNAGDAYQNVGARGIGEQQNAGSRGISVQQNTGAPSTQQNIGAPSAQQNVGAPSAQQNAGAERIGTQPNEGEQGTEGQQMSAEERQFLQQKKEDMKRFAAQNQKKAQNGVEGQENVGVQSESAFAQYSKDQKADITIEQNASGGGCN